MGSRIGKLILVICSILCLVGCSIGGKYKEGVIYSEKLLPNYKDDTVKEEIDDFLTREEAIEYAESIFEECFNKEIKRDKLSEMANIIQIDKDFYWNINWQGTEKNPLNEQYYIVINSKSKEVESCGVISLEKNEYMESDLAVNISEKDTNSIFNIAKPMIEKMRLKVEEYIIKPSSKDNRVALFIVTEKSKYILEIDLKTKVLVSFAYLREGEKDEYFNS